MGIKNRLGNLDLFRLAAQTGGKIRIGNANEPVKAYKTVVLMNGQAREHRFMMETCVITMVEDKR